MRALLATPLRGALAALLLAAAGAATAAAAAAEPAPYPERPVHLVVPFPPGGGFDVFARLLAAELGQRWGQPVVVDNRAGAGGTLGTAAVARATPDGYTLLLGHNGTLAINPVLYAEPGYDPERDFTWIRPLALAPLLVVVPASSPTRALGELLEQARSDPGALDYASGGSGTLGHMYAELLQSQLGLAFTHIPYRGNGAALQDLLGNRVDLMFAVVPAALPHVRAGKLRALAASAAARLPILPDVPTLAEAGVPSFETGLRYCVLAPAGTPDAIAAQIRARVSEALASPAFVAQLAAEGATPLAESSDELRAQFRAERERWQALIRSRSLRPG